MNDKGLATLIIGLKREDKNNPHGLASKTSPLLAMLGKGKKEEESKAPSDGLVAALESFKEALDSGDFNAAAEAFQDAHELACENANTKSFEDDTVYDALPSDEDDEDE